MEAEEILKRIGYDNNSITATELWIAKEVYKLAMEDSATLRQPPVRDGIINLIHEEIKRREQGIKNNRKMKKEYVVRDLETGFFYGALTFGWVDDIKLSYHSNTIEDAERVISQRQKGYYVIDVVYVV